MRRLSLSLTLLGVFLIVVLVLVACGSPGDTAKDAVSGCKGHGGVLTMTYDSHDGGGAWICNDETTGGD